MPFLAALLLLGAATPVNIIFDTDMHTDCDDAGALAVLHAFADEGLARIVGVIHTAPAPSGPKCADAINTYYGRGAIPVAGMTWPDYPASPRYAAYLASATYIETAKATYLDTVANEFPRTQTKDNAPIPDSVHLYRKLLANAEDHAIVICAVGQLAGLAGLLDSPPDDIAPLSGTDLVQRKVRLLVTMAGGVWPEGNDQFNWNCDRPSAARVLNHWPGALAVSPSGGDILTGGRLCAETPKDNPIRRIYEIYVLNDTHQRPSWDQCAVYYAVKGPDALFRAHPGVRLQYDAKTGHHQWNPDPASQQICIEQQAPSKTIATTIENLMIEKKTSH